MTRGSARLSAPALGLLLGLGLAPVPLAADEVTDTLDAARTAYDQGDVAGALSELADTQSLIQAMRTEGLVAYLPAAPAGWTRAVSTEMTGAMAMAGGGMAAEATYAKDAESFAITLIADSPMVMAMAPMLANPMMAAAAGGKLHRVGSIKVLEQDGSLAALVGNRVLMQAQGAAPETMPPLIETIDFDALAAFHS